MRVAPKDGCDLAFEFQKVLCEIQIRIGVTAVVREYLHREEHTE